MLTHEQIEMIGRCGFEDISYAKRWDATDQSIQNLIAAIRLAALDEAIAEIYRIQKIYDDRSRMLIDHKCNPVSAIHYANAAENIAVDLRSLKERK